jgi:hypothetical protein
LEAPFKASPFMNKISSTLLWLIFPVRKADRIRGLGYLNVSKDKNETYHNFEKIHPARMCEEHLFVKFALGANLGVGKTNGFPEKKCKVVLSQNVALKHTWIPYPNVNKK